MAKNGEEKKSFLSAVGNAVSKVGEMGVKAGDAIKDFAESETAGKITDSVKNGAKAAADGVAKGAKFAAEGVSTGAHKAAESIKANAEENAKKKEEKKALQEEIKAELEAEKARKKADVTDESNHTVIEAKKSKMRFLIPEGYEKLKPVKTGDPRVDKAKEKFFYRKSVSTCDSVVVLFDTSAEESMNFDGKQEVIDGIHQSMSDQQGLICVESGKTKRGYQYIYSIVKTLMGDFGGVSYYVRMNIGSGDNIYELQGTFMEARNTGIRATIGHELAHRAGLCEFSSFDGWFEDPYDPEYKNGIQMNLSERAGLDGLFPADPLSQAREFVNAILFDELMEYTEDEGPTSIFKEKDELQDSERNEQDEIARKEKEKEMLLPAFEKGEKCKRPRYTVEVK
jgi:hypothetical protein